MSTRTQLRFVDADGSMVAQVYNHSDGYPEGIIPSLVELRDNLEAAGWVRGPHYAAAQFIFLRKLNGLRFKAGEIAAQIAERDVNTERNRVYREMSELDGVGPARAEAAAQAVEALTDPSLWGEMGSAYFLGGHGVETGNIHGDEEYIYKVYVPHGPRDDSDWVVKVSGDFPEPEWETIGGETRGYDFAEGEDAWTEANWDYSGGLDGAQAIIDAAREEYDEKHANDPDMYQGTFIREKLAEQ